MIPCIPIIPTLIPRIPRIPTMIPRIPALIPYIPIIPLIPFPDSSLQLLQIARKVVQILGNYCYFIYPFADRLPIFLPLLFSW